MWNFYTCVGEVHSKENGVDLKPKKFSVMDVNRRALFLKRKYT